MDDLRTFPLRRDQIGAFIPTITGIQAFEAAQSDIGTVHEALQSASFLVVGNEPTLGSERVLTPVSGELVGTDSGANAAYSLGLADTAVIPGAYGNPAGFVTITVDKKGRLTDVSTFTISGASGVDYDNSTGVFSAHPAGTYAAPTGTVSRATFVSYAAGTTLTFGAAYVQAEHTALATRLAQVEASLASVSQVLAALITDMKANGNLS